MNTNAYRHNSVIYLAIQFYYIVTIDFIRLEHTRKFMQSWDQVYCFFTTFLLSNNMWAYPDRSIVFELPSLQSTESAGQSNSDINKMMRGNWFIRQFPPYN